MANKMRMKSRFNLFIFKFLCILLVLSCEKDNIDSNLFSPDQSGNLIIDNRTNKTLLLYQDNKKIKEVGANQSSFIVNIPNNIVDATSLEVWEKGKTGDDNNPSEENKFRQWDVVLPAPSVDANSRALWIIKDDGSNTKASGTLEFTYPEIDTSSGIPVIYSVDVILDNQTGSKITSIAPGTKNKKVGVEYGYRVLLFQYWYSDQNSSTGRQDVDWKIKNENSEDYSTILNANYPNAQIYVPIFYFSPIGRKGKIVLDNNTKNDIRIFANDDLIEFAVITDQPKQGLSLIRKDSQNVHFLIPEGQYDIEIKQINSSEALEEKSLRLIELYPFYWNLDGKNNLAEMTITNNSGKRVTLHDEETNNYIGYWLDDNESLTIQIEKSITTIKAKAWLKESLSAISSTNLQTWVIKELN